MLKLRHAIKCILIFLRKFKRLWAVKRIQIAVCLFTFLWKFKELWAV